MKGDRILNLRKKSHDHIILNGWKAAFITEAIENGSSSLEPLHPVYEVDPLINSEEDVPEAVRLNDENAEYFITPSFCIRIHIVIFVFINTFYVKICFRNTVIVTFCSSSCDSIDLLHFVRAGLGFITRQSLHHISRESFIFCLRSFAREVLFF